MTQTLRRFALLLLTLAAFAACSELSEPEVPAEGKDSDSSLAAAHKENGSTPDLPSVCPERGKAASSLPGVTDAHRDPAYWLERAAAYGDVDAVLMTPSQVRDHNRAFFDSPNDLSQPPERVDLETKLQERFDWTKGKFEDASYVDVSGAKLTPESYAGLELSLLPAVLKSELRIAQADVTFRCVPVEAPFYTPSLDLRFNRNNCSTAHAQEPVQVIAAWPDGSLLARTRYTYGWLAADAQLSAPLSQEQTKQALGSDRVELIGAIDVAGQSTSLPLGTTLARLETADSSVVRVGVATAKGWVGIDLSPEQVRSTARPLTRRAVLEEAFRFLDAPYGWGGEGGGRDCSRFLLDLFESFGLQLPRHSGTQAHETTFSIDISSVTNEKERIQLIEAAAKRGIVLLHLPGHIMLYLGRDAGGTPMVLHAFAEYLVPCAQADPRRENGGETLLEVDRVSLSDLELGRGTSRTAFIERITHISVLGGTPGVELQGVAALRRAAPVVVPTSKECKDSQAVAIFHSPRFPSSEQPMRVIATLTAEPGPSELSLLDPDGNRVTPPAKLYGGPPYGTVVTVDGPKDGLWTAVYGDGERSLACLKIRVRKDPSNGGERTSQTVWEPRRRWGESAENLYAIFVESLFDYPLEDDVTWKNMHSVVQDKERNLLYDHLGFGEDNELKMEPDCADLPYLLRAYFAWKMGLPYGYRRCSRGKAGKPPRCDEVLSSLSERESPEEVEGFSRFANRHVRNAVHSASGRTAPDDDETDFYPVALDRKGLKPGTLYADPYGHLLTIAGWAPQTFEHYGVLMAVDAQPDGTIGRRRFWRGAFLFTPDTTDVGAGFKAFRPVVVDPATNGLVAMTNAEINQNGEFAPFSRQQYEGSADDFYDGVESLINPRPLDPVAVQRSLVDALDESVARRVNSVDNGEQYMAEHDNSPIEMPTGYSIFETAGPWEDFSTPSRDMRLLISIDTVLQFAQSVRRAPQRFGLEEADVEPIVAEVEGWLAAELGKRTFTYTLSNGTPKTLTLQDLVERSAALEMAYHPNDCAEVRWGAPEGSEEMKTCLRRAPEEHHRQMETVRAWFHDRKRPPR